MSILARARRSRGVCGSAKSSAKQVHVHADDRERILDLVRERAGERGQLGVLVAELVEGIARSRSAGRRTCVAIVYTQRPARSSRA